MSILKAFSWLKFLWPRYYFVQIAGADTPKILFKKTAWCALYLFVVFGIFLPFFPRYVQGLELRWLTGYNNPYSLFRDLFEYFIELGDIFRELGLYYSLPALLAYLALFHFYCLPSVSLTDIDASYFKQKIYRGHKMSPFLYCTSVFGTRGALIKVITSVIDHNISYFSSFWGKLFDPYFRDYECIACLLSNYYPCVPDYKIINILGSSGWPFMVGLICYQASFYLRENLWRKFIIVISLIFCLFGLAHVWPMTELMIEFLQRELNWTGC